MRNAVLTLTMPVCIEDEQTVRLHRQADQRMWVCCPQRTDGRRILCCFCRPTGYERTLCCIAMKDFEIRCSIVKRNIEICALRVMAAPPAQRSTDR